MKTSNKIFLYSKKSAAVSLLLTLAFLFQNFSLSTVNVFLSLNPKNLSISKTSHKYDSKTNTSYFYARDNSSSTRTHEVKVQGEGELPYTFVYKQQNNTPVVAFEINNSLQNPISNDRSEIRLVGANSYFDQTYYSSFKFFYPEDSSQILNNNNTKKDWALIWQCPQIGSNTSPPLSIHIENDILSMTTITDFRVYKANDKPYYDKQPLEKLIRNKWYTVMVRYTLGLNGGYSFWIDGKKILLNADYNPQKLVETKYLPIGYKGIASANGSQLCSVRYGLYKNPSLGSYKILFSDVKFGTSYEGVYQANN
jgi:hypothetical protein